ncbi:MAG: DUF3560 domain-containing protein [Actinomycetales bacterium]|nr:DUF3560 domain-containing protein [Actinomycetales bacterium]
MSTRDRRLARAERLREWAAKREAKAEAAETATRDLADRIPFGQPILIGHHSEGRARRDADRIRGGLDRAAQDAETARDMNRRAATIEAQAAGSVYDDDPDAIDRLQARIADLEAERDRIKAYNVTARAGAPDLTLLTEREQRALLGALKYTPYASKGGTFPSYHLSGLSGRISTTRARIARLSGGPR